MMVKENCRKPSEIHRRNISYNLYTFLVSLSLSPVAFLQYGEKSKNMNEKNLQILLVKCEFHLI